MQLKTLQILNAFFIILVIYNIYSYFMDNVIDPPYIEGFKMKLSASDKKQIIKNEVKLEEMEKRMISLEDSMKKQEDDLQKAKDEAEMQQEQQQVQAELAAQAKDIGNE
jgi:hypothetical protein